MRKLEGKAEEWVGLPPPTIRSNWKHHHIQSNITFHSLLEGMQNATATLEDSLVISYIIIQSNNHMVFTQMNWKLMSMHKIIMLASFITVQTWKQSRCPSTGKRRNKFWYSAMRPNSYQDMEEPWMHITSDTRQSKKAIWQYGGKKGKSKKTMEKPIVGRRRRKKDMLERRGFLRQWNYNDI